MKYVGICQAKSGKFKTDIKHNINKNKLKLPHNSGIMVCKILTGGEE